MELDTILFLTSFKGSVFARLYVPSAGLVKYVALPSFLGRKQSIKLVALCYFKMWVTTYRLI